MIAQHGTLEISRSRLRHNVALMQRRVGAGVKLCATIKADAYGHGVAWVSELLREAGVEWVCVYSLEEAMAVAHLPWFGILVLSPLVIVEGETVSAEAMSALRGQVRVNITDKGTALRLAKALETAGIETPVNVHVQVDAGLTRVGVEPREAKALVEVIAGLKQLRLEGVFAHFSHGDVPGHESVGEQMRVLHSVADPIRKRTPGLMVHLQNSGGAWHVEDAERAGLNMVRVGIALYGLQPSTSDWVEGLLPIARVTARILAIHERPAGTGVGYGHAFVTRRASRLAIVPVGYADGYPRAMTNRAVAQVRGVDVPVVGRVSMDQIILDVTDVAGVRVGDVVTVVSWEVGKGNSLDAMADAVGTIGYELATHLGAGGGQA
ncbi:MAG: alanine racemase [Phycisphaerae bacterium]